MNTSTPAYASARVTGIRPQYFVQTGDRRAEIGSLDQIEDILAGNAGTQITMNGKEQPS